MIGIYLSGTGNTKHCVEKIIGLLDKTAKALPLEDADVIEQIKNNDTIIFGYPTQFSNAPYMVRDFINKNRLLWKNKKILCVATMGAKILGGVHIKMPDSVCDSKLLKKSIEKNREIIRQADKKIERIAEQIKRGEYPKDGITWVSHMAGLFGQRLWFYKKTAGYTDKLKINAGCTGCGLCASLCPMKNISVKNNRAVVGGKCTMCYRCISRCPQKAITLLGYEVAEQCRYEKYC